MKYATITDPTAAQIDRVFFVMRAATFDLSAGQIAARAGLDHATVEAVLTEYLDCTSSGGHGIPVWTLHSDRMKRIPS